MNSPEEEGEHLMPKTFDDFEIDESESFGKATESKEQYTINWEDRTVYIDTKDWRKSNTLKYQLFASYLGFTLFGLGESSVGALIPLLEEHYGITESTTGLIFIASVIGYFLIAIFNEHAHQLLGLRGVLVGGLTCVCIGFSIVSLAPPFPVLVPCFILSGIGWGSLDASLGSWMGKLVDSNPLLSTLHGFYGVGCTLSPLFISLLTSRGVQWNHYYLILVGFSAFCVINLLFSFRNETAAKYRYEVHLASIDNPDDEPVSMAQTLRSKVVWSFAIVLFIYVGGEIAFGSWLTSYLVTVIKGEYEPMLHVNSVYWTGLTAGRLMLGYATAKFPNEIMANQIYCAISGTLFFTFWLWRGIPMIVVNVFIAGFFVGPIFPATIVIACKVLPVKYHVSGVGFACAFGGSGAAVFPYLIGVVAETKFGLKYYSLFCGFLFYLVFVSWIVLSRVFKDQMNK